MCHSPATIEHQFRKLSGFPDMVASRRSSATDIHMWNVVVDVVAYKVADMAFRLTSYGT